jgi:hypothetical protein
MMTRERLDHLLRAAGAHTGQKTFVLVGSAAIFAWEALVPPRMAMSREIDIFAFDVSPEDAERIADELDGDLGQASQFDQQFGYYCDGVEPQTAILPLDWRDRAKEYSSAMTDGVVAIVPHPNDIGLSKLCAGREKDIDWVAAASANAMVNLGEMEALIERLPNDRPQADPDRLADLLKAVRSRRQM